MQSLTMQMMHVPGEIAAVLRIKTSLVRDWRRRAGKIDTAKARLNRVRNLLYPNKFGIVHFKA
jgi:hypothetical protein